MWPPIGYWDPHDHGPLHPGSDWPILGRWLGGDGVQLGEHFDAAGFDGSPPRDAEGFQLAMTAREDFDVPRPATSRAFPVNLEVSVPVPNGDFTENLAWNMANGTVGAWNHEVVEWTPGPNSKGGSYRPAQGIFDAPIPGGTVIAYLNQGWIETAIEEHFAAGDTLTARVFTGWRNDVPAVADAVISLIVEGSEVATARTNLQAAMQGDWQQVEFDYASARPIDLQAVRLSMAGSLAQGGGQANFSRVELTVTPANLYTS